MRNISVVFPFFLSLLFCGQLLAQTAPKKASETPTPERIKARDWQLSTESGKQIDSRDFIGKPLIIHFWATWCPYCKKLQPGLDKLYRTYQADGLQIIALSFKEDQGATPQAVLDARGISFETAVNADHVATNLFAVKGTPTTVFIDENGYIVASTRISDPNDPRLELIVKGLLEVR